MLETKKSLVSKLWRKVLHENNNNDNDVNNKMSLMKLLSHGVQTANPDTLRNEIQQRNAFKNRQST